MSEMRTVEWGVDYQDGCGPRKCMDGEELARRWVAHWNNHREHDLPALLVRRTVTTSAWEEE